MDKVGRVAAAPAPSHVLAAALGPEMEIPMEILRHIS